MQDSSRPKKTSNKENPKQFREKLFHEEGKKKEGFDKEKVSLRQHKNPFIRTTARAGYTIWIVVMAVGLLLAFVVSLFLL